MCGKEGENRFWLPERFACSWKAKKWSGHCENIQWMVAICRGGMRSCEVSVVLRLCMRRSEIGEGSKERKSEVWNGRMFRLRARRSAKYWSGGRRVRGSLAARMGKVRGM